MRKVIYKLKLDLKSTESGRGILIKRGDAATRELRITLVSGASPYPIEEHTTAILYCSGREPIYAACTVEDGAAVCVLPSAVSEERVRLCELRLIKSDTAEDTVDGMISSPSFRIVSDECVFGDGVIESSDSFSALTATIAKAETAITRAEEAVATSAAAVEKAESLVITSSRIENGELILVTAGGDELNAGRVAGARWYSGTAISGEGDGIAAVIESALEGDYYLNGETSEVYVCVADGVWGFVGSIKGTKGDKGDSVTIMSVEESTEDGGNNAVTFSDGTQLNVKNGSRGAQGVSGVYVGSGEMPEGYNVQIDPSGGYDFDCGLRLIRNLTTEEDVDRIDISTDEDGNPLSLNFMLIHIISKTSTESASRYVYIVNNNWTRWGLYNSSIRNFNESTASWMNESCVWIWCADGNATMFEPILNGMSNGGMLSNGKTYASIYSSDWYQRITSFSISGSMAAGTKINIIGY